MAEKILGKVAVTAAGTYDESLAYDRLTVVSYQGSSYMSKADVSAGVLPTDTSYWQLVASKGEQGEVASLAYMYFEIDGGMNLNYTVVAGGDSLATGFGLSDDGYLTLE